MSATTSVKLVAGTSPDWNVLIPACQSVWGTSPTRELDAKGIAIGLPSSYAMALEVIDGRRHVVNDISKAYRSKDFIHLTFLIAMSDCDAFRDFCNLAYICKLAYQDRNRGVGFFCGSIP
jgi:hypothetical protein